MFISNLTMQQQSQTASVRSPHSSHRGSDRHQYAPIQFNMYKFGYSDDVCGISLLNPHMAGRLALSLVMQRKATTRYKHTFLGNQTCGYILV